MQIAFVHTDLRIYWLPRLQLLSRSLRRRGDRLSVIEIAGSGSPYDFAGCNDTNPELDWCVLFPDGDLRTLAPRAMARAVECKLTELHPDVVMAGGIAFPSGAAAVRWARRNHRGVVVFDDARLEDVPRSQLVEFVKRRIYANVDAVLIPARSHLASYVHWGVPESRIFTGVNVVDNGWYKSRAKIVRERSDSFREERSLPSRFFLGVGRHIARKNWEICLSAYRLYCEQVPQTPWGLVLIGDGPDHSHLMDIVHRCQIPEIHMPGAIHGDELVGYYATADALVLPSTYGETWGLVVNEAMACGLPVLVSRCCGCAEALVRNGVNGWTFPPHDSTELAKRMLEMSALPAEAHRNMGLASEEIIASWGLDRFVGGAISAIAACGSSNKGFASQLDRLIVGLWNGRFRLS